ncbi:hypothetical protein QQ045_016287 [Rhodiola kirilowii]
MLTSPAQTTSNQTRSLQHRPGRRRRQPSPPSRCDEPGESNEEKPVDEPPHHRDDGYHEKLARAGTPAPTGGRNRPPKSLKLFGCSREFERKNRRENEPPLPSVLAGFLAVDGGAFSGGADGRRLWGGVAGGGAGGSGRRLYLYLYIILLAGHYWVALAGSLTAGAGIFVVVLAALCAIRVGVWWWLRWVGYGVRVGAAAADAWLDGLELCRLRGGYAGC